MMVGHRLCLGFILSVMRSHLCVQMGEAVIPDFLRYLWWICGKIDCDRTRKEAGKPVRRLSNWEQA